MRMSHKVCPILLTLKSAGQNVKLFRNFSLRPLQDKHGLSAPFGFDPYCEGKWLPLQDKCTSSVNSKKICLQKLWTNFEKSENLIFSKTAQPILMTRIYMWRDPRKGAYYLFYVRSLFYWLVYTKTLLRQMDSRSLFSDRVTYVIEGTKQVLKLFIWRKSVLVHTNR